MALEVIAGDGAGGGGGAGGNGGIIILCTTLETKKGIMADGNLVIDISKGDGGTKGAGGDGSTSGSLVGSNGGDGVDGLAVEIII